MTLASGKTCALARRSLERANMPAGRLGLAAVA
jgi:hypothetical protein